MKLKFRPIFAATISCLLVFMILGFSFIYLSRGYFEIVLVTVFILAWIIEHFVVKKHGGKKADK